MRANLQTSHSVRAQTRIQIMARFRRLPVTHHVNCALHSRYLKKNYNEEDSIWNGIKIQFC
jgi:hypothetical protein